MGNNRGNNLESFLRNMPAPEPQQQQMVLPWIEAGGCTINFTSIVAIDWRDYTEGQPGRFARLLMAHGVTLSFEDADADRFRHWYLTFTGQARVTG